MKKPVDKRTHRSRVEQQKSVEGRSKEKRRRYTTGASRRSSSRGKMPKRIFVSHSPTPSLETITLMDRVEADSGIKDGLLYPVKRELVRNLRSHS